MKFKSFHIIRITTLIMVMICLYKIYLCFGVLSYQSKLIYGSSVKGPISFLILIEMIIYLCAIVIAVAMYFRKSWSHRPALVINYYFLVTSSLSLLLFIPKFRLDLLNREAGYLISIILPLTASLWCVFYLRRSDVRANFNKDKTITASANIESKGRINSASDCYLNEDSSNGFQTRKEPVTATLEPKRISYKSKVVFGILLSILILVMIIFIFQSLSTSVKSAAHIAKSSMPPTYDRSMNLYKLGCSRAVHEIIFSADGQHIYTFDNDSNLIMWDTVNGKEAKIFEGILGRLGMAYFSPDGKAILTRIGANLVIFDLQSEKEISRIEIESESRRIMRTATFSHDGRYIIRSVDKNLISVWDLYTGKTIKNFRGINGWADSIASSPDGKYLVAKRIWGTERSIILWDYETGKKLWEHDSKGKETFIRFSPNGKFIAVGTYTSDVILFLNSTNGNQIKDFSGHSGPVHFINFSPDGKYLLSGGKDATIKLWEVASGKEIKQLVGHSSSLITAQFSPDGKNIVSASSDETIRLWSTASGKEIRRLERDCHSFHSVSFSPSGNHILSVGSDNSLRLWDVQSGEQIKLFHGDTDKVFTAMFSSDGKYVVSSAANNKIVLLDALSGKKIKTFSGHTDFISSAVFTPDGKSIVSGSNDKTIRIWGVSSGMEIQKWFLAVLCG